MSAEDRLRELLREEASMIVPTADGLSRIQTRVAARRRWRNWVLPSAALVVGATAAAVVLLTPGSGHKTQVLTPATSTPTAPAPSASPAPKPIPGDDGGQPLSGAAIWPFTSQAQAQSWQTTYPWAQDGLAVGKHFMTDYLKITDVTVTQTCVSCGVLSLTAGGRNVGQITMMPFGIGFASGHPTHLYTVVGVDGTDLTITSPTSGAAITSPTNVTGRITGVDENVRLRLLSTDGRELATTSAPAGSAVPWSGTLTWTASDWSTGSIVGVTRSAKDGTTNRVVAVPVKRATASPTAAFAGISNGHVSLFDATSGAVVRQLTYPPSGTSDVADTWSAGQLVWVRTHGASACVDELDRLANGRTSIVLKSTTSHLLSPQLSPSGGILAWVDAPCDGRTQHVVVSGGGSPDRRVEVPHDARVLDAQDDGTVLVWEFNPAVLGGNLVVVSGGSTTTLSFTVANGCGLGPAAAFDGSTVDAFETCNNASTGQLVHYDSNGARKSVDHSVPLGGQSPLSLSVRDGAFLVAPGSSGASPVDRYSNGVLTQIATGITDPDW